MRRTFIFLSIVFFIALGSSLKGQKKESDEVKKVQYGQLNEQMPRGDVGMKKWRDNRFGQFIHWGLYAIPGGVWKGKTYAYAAEFLKSSAKISSETWDSLQYQFNPVKYNAKEWALMAKDMGVKYVTITTKHHEGFCLWPSEYTDFDIESTPYKKDLLGEFVEEYTKQGIDVNFYYSVLDWHNPDWRYDLKNQEDSIAFDRLKEFTQNQLVELVERYPQVKGLWFDGTWDNSWKKNGKFSFELEKLLKEKRPGLIVNSRLRADEYGSRHFDTNGQLMGDYESGYERRLPNAWDTKVTKNDWECCMTIPYNQWGYHKDWTISHVKTAYELIEMMTQCVSQGGNFLLNFGPKGDGSFRNEEVAIARSIGEWMKENGRTIYACGYAGLKKQSWGYYTKPNNESNKIYMLVFNKPISGQYQVKLPKGKLIKKAYLLQSPDNNLKIEEIAKYEYFISPENSKGKQPFVIVIELVENESDKVHQKALT